MLDEEFAMLEGIIWKSDNCHVQAEGMAALEKIRDRINILIKKGSSETLDQQGLTGWGPQY